MSRLAVKKKTPMKQSEFQKLWAQAEKLKRKNERFRDRLDEILQRVSTEIRPVEDLTARLQIPLLKRLLTLGLRKSLSQWQREVLDGWIREILELLQSTANLHSDIMDDLARYDAFRLGYELDEGSPASVAEQLQAHMEREDRLQEQEFEAQEKAWRENAHQEVEKILDRTFGPKPLRPENVDAARADLFQDELKQEQQRAYQAYHENRNAAREDLLKEMLRDNSPDEEDDEFDFDFDPFGTKPFTQEEESGAAAISNTVFKRLFRGTAAKLHPDREQDPNLREKKHELMARLLNAREQGDVMTIIQMHQQHVGDDNALCQADEKELIKILKVQVNELRCAGEEYTYESPLHRMAFDVFYSPSQKQTELAFKQYRQTMEKNAAQAQALSQSITSIKTLSPHLEQRYEEYYFTSPFDALFE